MEDDCLASGPRGLDCRRKPVTFLEPLDAAVQHRNQRDAICQKWCVDKIQAQAIIGRWLPGSVDRGGGRRRRFEAALVSTLPLVQPLPLVQTPPQTPVYEKQGPKQCIASPGGPCRVQTYPGLSSTTRVPFSPDKGTPRTARRGWANPHGSGFVVTPLTKHLLNSEVQEVRRKTKYWKTRCKELREDNIFLQEQVRAQQTLLGSKRFGTKAAAAQCSEAGSDTAKQARVRVLLMPSVLVQETAQSIWTTPGLAVRSMSGQLPSKKRGLGEQPKPALTPEKVNDVEDPPRSCCLGLAEGVRTYQEAKATYVPCSRGKSLCSVFQRPSKEAAVLAHRSRFSS
ncbi:hypothetical protein ISCGN_018721 [Ixodes scapularis]